LGIEKNVDLMGLAMGFVILSLHADVSRTGVQNAVFMNYASEDSV